MKKFARAAAFAALFASAPAAALIPWGGAGWYVFEVDGYMEWAVEGRFSNEQSCVVRLKVWQEDSARQADGKEYQCAYEDKNYVMSFDEG